MIAKILIATGTLMIFASVIAIGGGIYRSFSSMKTNGSAGIGAVGSGLPLALVSNIFVFVGLAVLIIGLVKFFKEKNRPK